MTEQKSFNGLKFNNLTIIDNAPSRRTPCGDLERRVVVKCECGNIKDLSWKSVKRGKTKSCGCLSLEIKIDIVLNNTYNYWTILNEVSPYITSDGSKMRKVLAECICGNRKEVLLNTLRAGKIKSCGCMTEHKTGYQNVSVDSPIPEIPIDKINKRQMGYWKVIELISAKRNENREIIRTVKAQCKCGYVKEVLLDNLGASKQCSTCAMSEIKSKISEEDRILRTRLKGVYQGMKKRCNNTSSKDYKNYGGRGIKIEDSFNTFDKFYDWMILNKYIWDCKLEIDRKDNEGGYSTDNCRLVSRVENNRNMRRNVMTWEIVNEIRYGKYIEMSNKYIAEVIGCCEATVSSVRHFYTWKE